MFRRLLGVLAGEKKQLIPQSHGDSKDGQTGSDAKGRRPAVEVGFRNMDLTGKVNPRDPRPLGQEQRFA